MTDTETKLKQAETDRDLVQKEVDRLAKQVAEERQAKPKLRHGDYGLSGKSGMRIHLWSFIKGFDWKDPTALTGDRQDYSEIGVRTDDNDTIILGNIFADLEAIAKPLEEFVYEGYSPGKTISLDSDGDIDLGDLKRIMRDDIHGFILKLRRMEAKLIADKK